MTATRIEAGTAIDRVAGVARRAKARCEAFAQTQSSITG